MSEKIDIKIVDIKMTPLYITCGIDGEFESMRISFCWTVVRNGTTGEMIVDAFVHGASRVSERMLDAPVALTDDARHLINQECFTLASSFVAGYLAKSNRDSNCVDFTFRLVDKNANT